MKGNDVRYSTIEALKRVSVLNLVHVHVVIRLVEQVGETTETLPDSCHRKEPTKTQVFLW